MAAAGAARTSRIIWSGLLPSAGKHNPRPSSPSKGSRPVGQRARAAPPGHAIEPLRAAQPPDRVRADQALRSPGPGRLAGRARCARWPRLRRGSVGGRLAHREAAAFQTVVRPGGRRCPPASPPGRSACAQVGEYGHPHAVDGPAGLTPLREGLTSAGPGAICVAQPQAQGHPELGERPSRYAPSSPRVHVPVARGQNASSQTPASAFVGAISPSGDDGFARHTSPAPFCSTRARWRR